MSRLLGIYFKLTVIFLKSFTYLLETLKVYFEVDPVDKTVILQPRIDELIWLALWAGEDGTVFG